MIPRSFIEDLLSRIDIVDVIERVIRLKKTGKNFSACCPFHLEKTPSFTVNPDKQFYYCFGCSAHGNAIGFLMAYDKMSFVESVQYLANLAGLPIPQEALEISEKPSDQIGLALEKAYWFYQKQLKTQPSNARICVYLEQRDVQREMIEQFGLGFAPPGWDALLRFLQAEKILLSDAVSAGLLVEKEGGKYYDRFRDRLMFPIRNRKGKIIGFGGRVLNDQDKPKYLNSPETPLFHKGRELYGLYEMRDNIREVDKILVVEGYMDAIALVQNGIPNVVATLGTAITEHHIEQLIRLVPHVVYCFDGDLAGQQAAWRALQTSLPLLESGKHFSFLILPQNEDPDSLIRSKGQAYFLTLVASAVPLFTFLFRKLSEPVNLATIEGKAQFFKTVKEYLAKIRDPFLVNLGLEELSKITRLTTAYPQNRATVKKQYKNLQKNKNSLFQDPIRLPIALVLQKPELAFTIKEPIPGRKLNLPGILVFLHLVEMVKENPNIPPGLLLEKCMNSENQAMLASLTTWDCPIPPEGMAAELEGALRRLSQLEQDQEMELLLTKSRLTGLDSEEKQQLRALIMTSYKKTL